MQRGEIWWACLPQPAGSAPGFRRPVLIVQADSFTRSKINTVVIAVITSNTALAVAPGNVLIKPRSSRLPKDSVVNVSQLFTADKASLTEKVGSLDRHTMEQVDIGLRMVLSL
jgi:mRNA interferase MazF